MNDEQTALLRELVAQVVELRKELTLKHGEPLKPLTNPEPNPWHDAPPLTPLRFVPYPYWQYPPNPYWTEPYITWC